MITREQIASANSHELNELVAIHIFGDEIFHLDSPGGAIWSGKRNGKTSLHPLFNFSQNMLFAWEVVQEVRKKNNFWSPAISWDDDDGGDAPCWVAAFYYYGETTNQFRSIEVWNESAEIAICKASLYTLLDGSHIEISGQYFPEEDDRSDI